MIVNAAKFAAFLIPQREQESGQAVLDWLQVRTMIEHRNQKQRSPPWEIHHVGAQKRNGRRSQKNLMPDHAKQDYGQRS